MVRIFSRVFFGGGLEVELGVEVGDDGFFDGRDYSEGADAGIGEFASETDHGVFVDVFDHFGHVVIEFDVVVAEIILGVVVGDLADGLGAHLVAAQSVGLGRLDVSGVEFAT